MKARRQEDFPEILLPVFPPSCEFSKNLRASQALRGTRYCEIFLGYQERTDVSFDVYTTHGLNECPAEAWDEIDPEQLKEEFQAAGVVMNGPRHWVIDGMVNSELLDPSPVDLAAWIAPERAAGATTPWRCARRRAAS